MFECLFHHTPDYNFLHIFECFCFPYLLPYHAHKLDFYFSPCVFLGYSSSHLGYHYLDLTSQRICISRHVCFYEHVFSFNQSEQITHPPNISPHHIPITHLPNLFNSLFFHSLTPATFLPPIMFTISTTLRQTNNLSLYHYMLVYLMIIIQVQVPPL